jgi:hypothetical protein
METLIEENRNYLLKDVEKQELQKMVKDLGKSIYKGRWHANSSHLVDIIMNDKNFQMKTKEFFEQKKLEKKVEYYKSLPERLYSNCVKKFNKNYEKPCLEYNNIDSDGYGSIKIMNKPSKSHIVSYALSQNIFVEDIKRQDENDEMMDICHGHDCSRACIEPSHLSLKTKRENLYNDRLRDGTLKFGETHPACKINEELAKQIKYSKGAMSWTSICWKKVEK